MMDCRNQFLSANCNERLLLWNYQGISGFTWSNSICQRTTLQLVIAGIRRGLYRWINRCLCAKLRYIEPQGTILNGLIWLRFEISQIWRQAISYYTNGNVNNWKCFYRDDFSPFDFSTAVGTISQSFSSLLPKEALGFRSIKWGYSTKAKSYDLASIDDHSHWPIKHVHQSVSYLEHVGGHQSMF